MLFRGESASEDDAVCVAAVRSWIHLTRVEQVVRPLSAKGKELVSQWHNAVANGTTPFADPREF